MATILVEILGNAKQFKHELDGAVASTDKANSGFAKMGKVAAVAGAAIVGGIAVGLTKSVEAAMKGQEATARMNAAFVASGVSAKKAAAGIEEAEASARKLGFTNEDVKGSLGSLIVATHNSGKAIKDLGVAQDIARFKHVSLETATKTLTMAMAGSQKAVKALGLSVSKSTEATDAAKDSYKKHLDALKAQFPATEKQTAAEHELYLKKKNALDLSYDADKALAKTTDLHATAAKVIATVSEKLHGQADAYSNTAAGGMAAFHAQLGDLEEQIGTVFLPVLTTVTKWLAEELPVGIAMAKQVIADLTPTFNRIVADVQQVVTAIRAHWTEIVAVFTAAKAEVVAQLNLLGDLIHGRWDKIWGDVVTLLQAKWDLVVAAVKLVGPILLSALEAVGAQAVSGLKSGLAALPGALESAMKALPGLALATAKLVGEAIVAGVKWAVPHIAGLAGDLTEKISAAISQVAGWAVGEAEKIGAAIVKGVISGIKSAPGAIGGAIKGVVGGGLSWASKNIGSTADEASSALIGVPLAQGVIEGWLMGSASLPTKISESVQNAITAGRAVIQDAQASFQTAWSALAPDANSALAGSQSSMTKAGKELAELQAGHDAAGRQQALDDANAKYDAARAGGDPAAILASRKAVDDALYQMAVADLQKESAAQQIELNARNALQQRHFDAALTKLETHLAKGHSTYEEAHKAILKLFKSFGISYAAAGAALGVDFITGLKETIQGAAKQSGSLSGKLDTVAAGIKIPHAATGGFVEQSGLAVIHQGETITPAGQGGGVTVVVNGWVGNDQDIAEKIRNTLIRTGRNTTGGVLGGF